MLCRPASECTDLKVSAVCNFYCAAQKIVKKADETYLQWNREH